MARDDREDAKDASRRPLCPLCSSVSSVPAAIGSPRQEPAAPAGCLGRAAHRRRSTSSAISTTRPAPTRRARSAARRRRRRCPRSLQAVAEHADGYVRYRALVLLTGFNDPRTKDAMRESLASPNDRLRDRRLQLLRAQSRSARWCRQFLDRARQGAGRVRPAGARPRAGRRTAHGSARPRRRCCARSAAARISSAAPSSKRSAITRRRTRSTRSPRSPSSTARCRTMRRWRSGRSATSARSRRWPRLQRTAPRATQPSIAAAICLLGVNCESHENYLDRDAEVRGQEPRLPGAAARRRGGPWRARRRGPRRSGRQRLFDGRHSVATIRPARRWRWRWRPWRCATRR